MKRRGWSPEEEGELEQFCADASAAGGSQAERISVLVDSLQRGLATGSRWVRVVEAEAWRMAAASLLRDYARASRPALRAVTPDGRTLAKSRSSATFKRDDDGAEYVVQELFDFKTWDELTRELMKAVSLAQSHEARTRMIARLLGLRDEVPGAATPAEALAALRIDMQEWLDSEDAAA